MKPTTDVAGLPPRLFPQASAELLRLYAAAAENGGLLPTDFYTVRDLLELSGYLDQEALHGLLLVMLLALDEGSLCVEASPGSLTRLLTDLVGSDEAEAWAKRIVARAGSEDYGNLIGERVEDGKPIVRCRRGRATFFYFQKYLKHETQLRELVTARLAAGRLTFAESLPSVLHTVLKTEAPEYGGKPLRLNRAQQLALALGLLRNFVIISGGPGTGKTSIVFSLLRCLVRNGISPERIALAAPTGRAAQRLTDAIHSGLDQLKCNDGPDALLRDLKAQTLHRLLRYQPTRGTFRHHAENPLPVDVLVVDEVSMVGLVLMSQLFGATLPETKLILLGDKDQLPSVEAGALLANLIPADGCPRYSAELVKAVTRLLPDFDIKPNATPYPLRDVLVILEENYRSEKRLQEIARAVNRQEVELIDRLRRADLSAGSFPALSKQGGGWFLDLKDGSLPHWRRVLEQWAQSQYLTPVDGGPSFMELAASWVSSGSVANPTEEDQLHRLFALLARARVLTLFREGPWGCVGINQTLERIVRPRGDRSKGLFAGAPVLITRNDYNRELFNGDVGICLGDTDSGHRVVFQRHGGFEFFAAEALPAHELAFALTVHKSQGSEYGQVLLVLPPEGGRRLLTKEMIYTSITRAKELAVVCGSEEALRRAICQRIERQGALVAGESKER
jgi:exodeoxyribonuclease V alpha subunit